MATIRAAVKREGVVWITFEVFAGFGQVAVHRLYAFHFVFDTVAAYSHHAGTFTVAAWFLIIVVEYLVTIIASIKHDFRVVGLIAEIVGVSHQFGAVRCPVRVLQLDLVGPAEAVLQRAG